ncbi:Atg28p-like protein [Stachybotrys elegans]|uniref:Atg28p-like protein n=1 Tax=Stachybotrys elegans TaxID=80388 RepID=A0A8K0T0J1_9HYPO|nr:Atg28p-like protein [Stachybotrys elegans]
MASPVSLLDRLGSPRASLHMLPFRPSSGPSDNEYPLDELDPRPEDALLEEHEPRARLRKANATATPRQQSPASWNDGISSAGSSSKLPSHKMKSKPMFAGPPPPISKSMVMSRPSKSSSPYHQGNSPQDRASSGSRAGLVRIGGDVFDRRDEIPARSSDSIWRGLRRQERALEQEVQQLLDLQATGLVAGSQMPGSDLDSEVDGHSDAGSSTPTGTFYSTATSKSRMLNSLYVPTRSTAEGNVIPVRQPAKNRPMGLRSARAGLKDSLDALAELKQEEDAHVDAALAQRKKALVHISRLSSRKDRIDNELHILQDDEEEPLGRELRELDSKYASITEEIRAMEEKLVGMRNQRRWLKEKMSDVKNKREAGLSGYRGALKDVESEVSALLRRPPIQPLDPEMLSQGKDTQNDGSLGGMDFLRLIPERRTLDMAKSWWEDEVSILERRKSQIGQDRQALEEGSAVWQEVVKLVTNFETNLRVQMKNGGAATESAKGKDKMPSPEEMIQDQLRQMDTVVEELERHMQLAESKHWNLLICAIGAELEAFQEARSMLRNVVMTAGAGDEELQPPTTSQPGSKPGDDRHAQDESDNEVPPDLLVSHYEERRRGSSLSSEPSDASRPTVDRSDSENEVPPEFLAGS